MVKLFGHIPHNTFLHSVSFVVFLFGKENQERDQAEHPVYAIFFLLFVFLAYQLSPSCPDTWEHLQSAVYLWPSSTLPFPRANRPVFLLHGGWRSMTNNPVQWKHSKTGKYAMEWTCIEICKDLTFSKISSLQFFFLVQNFSTIHVLCRDVCSILHCM